VTLGTAPARHTRLSLVRVASDRPRTLAARPQRSETARTLRASLSISVVAVAGCSHAVAVASVEPPSAVYRAGIAHFAGERPSATAAGVEEGELHADMLTAVLHGAPVEVVHIDVTPHDAQEATRASVAAKVDAVVFGLVRLEDTTLVIERHAVATSGSDIGKDLIGWQPNRYDLRSPDGRAARALEARRFGQAILYSAVLDFLLRDEPVAARAALEALVSHEPGDWVALNEDLVERRWGILYRFLRDGTATEARYRRALAEIETAKVKSAAGTEGAKIADHKNAFYTVGLARGLLIQRRIADAHEVLSGSFAQHADDFETRQLVGRTLLDLHRDAEAARVLAPLAKQGFDVVSDRLFAVAVQDRPDAREQVEASFAVLARFFPGSGFDAALRTLVLRKSPDPVQPLTAGSWDGDLRRFAAGEVSAVQLLQAAEASDHRLTRERQCQAHELIGERLLIETGAQAEADAIRHFEAALETRAFALDAYQLADFWVERLNQDQKSSR
jgi:hypothetical protein